MRKSAAVLQAFEAIWRSLFESPIHLDSALSKQARSLKSSLAQILSSILLRPVSLAKELGLPTEEGKPWSMNAKGKGHWSLAPQLAELLHLRMETGLPAVEPVEEDFPPELVAEWEKSYGKETKNHLVRALGKEAPMSIRVTHKVGAQKLLSEFQKSQKVPVPFRSSKLSPVGIQFEGYAPILSSDWGMQWYEMGAFEIQDEGSQVMAAFALWPNRFAPLLTEKPGPHPAFELGSEILREERGITVVDTCAGAGGKTLALADFLSGKGRVYAYDTSPKKLQALRRRVKRAGINNVQAVVLEEEKEVETIRKFRKRAQVVLVDAPCSGWGVLRRNPDIKWRLEGDSDLSHLQLRLLETYSELVASGGRLVFGVCTFRESETKGIVEAFSKAHPEFVPGPGGFLGPDQTDGFFMQSWERT